MRYDQHAPRASIEGLGTTVGRHEAYLEVDDNSNECTVRVPYRPRNQPPRAQVDVLMVTVENDQPEDKRCATAKQLTEVAADNMYR